ncbi:MAG: phosphomannomutase/phosphoglucomutase, partial [Rhodovibrionaceae bacterium]
ELEEAVARGLRASGVTALRIGRGPTPLLYFAVYELDADGGIMVTGSHNPPDHNGFKIMLGKASFFGKQLQELGALAASGDFAAGEGGEETHDLSEIYLARITEGMKIGPDLKVAWDAGNGAAGEIMSRLTQRLPGSHALLNAEIDGSFPNHHPDPTVPANLEQLQQAVREGGCDLGIAFDGDGDRIGAVDQNGGILWGDQLMLYLARDILKERPGATIIADVKASQVLFDEIARLGGRPLMWKTGHSLIKAKMLEENAPFAGEMSAHLFFADRYYGFDDALYAAVRLLTALTRSGESLADFRAALPPVVNTPELRFDCPAERKLAVIEEVRARLDAKGAEVSGVDGVRVKDSAGGWWLLRASNTQDVLVARCEAPDQEHLDSLYAELSAQLRESGLEPPPLT